MRDLTKDEARWLRRLQKVLNECPSNRLGFYTIGDPYVTVYNKEYDEEIELRMGANDDFGPEVHAVGAALGSLTFPSQVHSTAG